MCGEGRFLADDETRKLDEEFSALAEMGDLFAARRMTVAGVARGRMAAVLRVLLAGVAAGREEERRAEGDDEGLVHSEMLPVSRS